MGLYISIIIVLSLFTGVSIGYYKTIVRINKSNNIGKSRAKAEDYINSNFKVTVPVNDDMNNLGVSQTTHNPVMIKKDKKVRYFT